MSLLGLYLAGCMVLAVAGCAKAWRPDDTARALAGSLGRHPTAMRRVVRAGAVVEALIGTVALVDPSPLSAGAMAFSYGAFALFVVYARRRGGTLASCGCFGTPDVPATRLHVVADLVMAVAGASIAVGRGGPNDSSTMAGLLVRQPLHGLPLVLMSMVCAWLMVHAMTTLPRTMAERRPPTWPRP